MKILVCISKTPDTTAKVTFTANNTKFAEEGIQWIINPYDEWYALVRAIELKESGIVSAIHLITVGNADCDLATFEKSCFLALSFTDWLKSNNGHSNKSNKSTQ